MYIFRFETFLEQNTPLRIVKLLEFKIEADDRRKQTLHYVQKT